MKYSESVMTHFSDSFSMSHSKSDYSINIPKIINVPPTQNIRYDLIRVQSTISALKLVCTKLRCSRTQPENTCCCVRHR